MTDCQGGVGKIQRHLVIFVEICEKWCYNEVCEDSIA